MRRFNHYMPQPMLDNMRRLSERTDLSVSELLRRMAEHCLQDRVLFDILPRMSGQITLGK